MAAPFQDVAVLFGDSITNQQHEEGNMQARFSSAYRRKLDILNRGYGGYNTRWTRLLFDTIFAKKEDAASVPTVRLVTIWFGANDSVLPDAEQKVRQHVPLDEYTSNLRFFLESLTSPSSPYAAAHAKGLNIVLVTPPPIYPAAMGGGPFSRERVPEVSRGYVDAVRALAAEFKSKETPEGNWRVGLVDMWDGVIRAAGGEGEELRAFLSDGLHLTSRGYGVFWDEYTALVRGELRGRGLDWEDVDDLPLRMPNFEHVDADDPSTVLSGMRLPPIRQ